jgi:hypothetical protein
MKAFAMVYGFELELNSIGMTCKRTCVDLQLSYTIYHFAKLQADCSFRTV